jgi:hypothetical protein
MKPHLKKSPNGMWDCGTRVGWDFLRGGAQLSVDAWRGVTLCAAYYGWADARAKLIAGLL